MLDAGSLGMPQVVLVAPRRNPKPEEPWPNVQPKAAQSPLKSFGPVAGMRMADTKYTLTLHGLTCCLATSFAGEDRRSFLDTGRPVLLSR